MHRFSNKVYQKKKPPGRWGSRKITAAASTIPENNVSASSEVRCENVPVSSSSKKLIGSSEKYSSLLEQCNEQNTNEIMNISILSKVLENSVLYKECKQSGMSLKTKRHIGLAAEMILHCKICQYSVSFFNSESVELSDGNNSCKYFDFNVRLVYGLRSIGKGMTAGKMFCGIMNLPPPPTKFGKYNVEIGSCVEDVAQESMQQAIEEAVEENVDNPDTQNPRDLAIALDGT